MKKILVTSLCVIVAAVLLIVIFSAIAKNDDNKDLEGNKTSEKRKNVGKEKEKEKEEKDKDEDDDKYSSEDPKVYKPYERQKILLDEEKEVFEVDENLTITLTGTKENYGDNSYTYVASIKLGANEVDAKVFNNPENRVIYSHNHGAEFFVDRIDDVYIVSSYMTNNMNGYSISIFNTDGDVLKEFEDVILELSGNMVTLSLKDVGANQVITETRFTIAGKNINVEYERVK